jgi:site-specific recombinase XerD
MARRPEPWYWQERETYMVTVRGVRHNLGPYKKKAFEAFYELMGKPKSAVTSGTTIDTVMQSFLDWTKENREQGTFDGYFRFLDPFEKRFHGLPVKELNAGHVQIWLNEKKTWNSTTKRSAITAIMRCFNWAAKNMGLDKNPVKGMEKPEAKRRTTVITHEEFEKLLAGVNDQPFRDLMIVSYDTGARPFEIKNLEARHVQLEKQRAVIPGEEAKGGIPRAIYFPTERSLEVVKRLTKKNATGPLFKNNRGNKWTGYAVKNRLEDLETALGKRINHYALRHSFVTRKLLAGVDSHIVASLAGHRDTKMIDSTYSHVAQDHAFMLEAAQKDITAPSVSAKKKRAK